MLMTKVSIIIPVHNGEKYIRKTISDLLRQTHNNMEIILVENGSQDGSWELCKELMENANIVAVQNKEKGTSLARKKGIELATGKYIIFSDQDDSYCDKHSICKMCNAIEEDNASICQFGHRRNYGLGFKKKICKTDKDIIISKKELYGKYIAGIISSGNHVLDTTVWSKIYDAELLKDAVRDVTSALYYGEDMYLNTLAFFNKKLKCVSIRSGSGFYIWNAKTGVSGKESSAEKLFDEYRIIKPLAIQLARKSKVNEKFICQCYIETVYFYKNLICNRIKNNENRRITEKRIWEIETFEFVQEAKQYISCMNENDSWPELRFLSGKYSISEYYDYCKNHMPENNVKQKVWNFLKRGKNKNEQ